MSSPLARLCASHGIAPCYVGIDGVEHFVPEDTLSSLARAFGIDEPSDHPLSGGIDDALAEADPPRCHVPPELENARVWGLTCQLSSLHSARNAGMGDFADLAELCRVAAAQGADFIGVNPLHALFWSAPERVSPFFPSDRRFLNPLYVALDWIDGFAATAAETEQAARLRSTTLLDVPAVARLKQAMLRRAYDRFEWTADADREFAEFRATGGRALETHGLFESLSAASVASGGWAGWHAWPEDLQDRTSPAVADFAAQHGNEIRFHIWLQWQAERQVERVQREAREAGMHVGLYLDFAVGAAPDGAAAWADPDLTVPGASIGAPADLFNVLGQDWGLAPISPMRLEAARCRPFADILDAVMRPAGAVRIDHAMSLARLWLIPRGMSAANGAYVRYPLSGLLARLAEASRRHHVLVIGEDLGVVPEGFRPLMESREIHAYKVLLFEHDGENYRDPAGWPVSALACVATHDMASFTGWWRGLDLDVREGLGMLSEEGAAAERATRQRDRAAIERLVGGPGSETEISVRLHGVMASSPCRLAALQIEDALGVPDQVNIPGTVDEHPNWRRRLPVALDRLGEHSGFKDHCAAMRRARPR